MDQRTQTTKAMKQKTGLKSNPDKSLESGVVDDSAI